MQETLHCRAGHDFKRDRVRGKKPIWCPEHRPYPVVAPKTRREARVRNVTMEGTEPKAPKLVTGPDSRPDITAILRSSRVDDETKRKLRYTDSELDKKREQPDINLLIDVRKRLIKEATRTMGSGVRVAA